MKSYKSLCISILAFMLLFFSCKSHKQEYFLLKNYMVSDYDMYSSQISIITYTNTQKKCKMQIYASQAICYHPLKNDTIRIVSLCRKYHYEFGENVNYRNSKIPFSFSDSIFVAYDENTEKYINEDIPTYVGELFVFIQ